MLSTGCSIKKTEITFFLIPKIHHHGFRLKFDMLSVLTHLTLIKRVYAVMALRSGVMNKNVKVTFLWPPCNYEHFLTSLNIGHDVYHMKASQNCNNNLPFIKFNDIFEL